MADPKQHEPRPSPSPLHPLTYSTPCSCDRLHFHESFSPALHVDTAASSSSALHSPLAGRGKELQLLEPQHVRMQRSRRCEPITGIQYQTIRRHSGMLSALWLLLIGRGGYSHVTPDPSSCLRKPLPDASPLAGAQRRRWWVETQGQNKQ
ncbi:unnamed protein product [Pleuronectes platessa]|uniref:Uncharacterized protein n=1 Tax=Pleuronectes platessa TaxID=8262 RepID=A0A9N7Z2H4_PLEPL|nr:unnamed protein product [Pleuronectes platessa]